MKLFWLITHSGSRRDISSSNYYSKQELLRATCATTTLLLLPLRARLGKTSTIFCVYNGGGGPQL
jgi:hypothetical protein